MLRLWIEATNDATCGRTKDSDVFQESSEFLCMSVDDNFSDASMSPTVPHMRENARDCGRGGASGLDARSAGLVAAMYDDYGDDDDFEEDDADCGAAAYRK